jgi:hypothetical protein
VDEQGKGQAFPCPSCGSAKTVPVNLWLIPSRYYECAICKLTFRLPQPHQDPPDVTRFNEGWTLPPDKPKK